MTKTLPISSEMSERVKKYCDEHDISYRSFTTEAMRDIMDKLDADGNV